MRWSMTSRWLFASAGVGLLMLPMATCQPNDSSNYNETMTMMPLVVEEDQGIWMDSLQSQFASMEEMEAHLIETGELQPQNERELLNFGNIVGDIGNTVGGVIEDVGNTVNNVVQQVTQSSFLLSMDTWFATFGGSLTGGYYELQVPNPDPLIDIEKAGYFANLAGFQAVHLSSGHTWTNANTKHTIIRAGGDANPPTATAPQYCSVGSASQPHITVDLGKGNDCFVSGVIIYHAENQEYCGLRVELSVDNINWKRVFDAGASYAPVQRQWGYEVRFYRKRARYIRVFTGRNKNNQNVAFNKLEIKGLSKLHSLRVGASGNGKYAVTGSQWTTNLGSHKFDPIKADGSYSAFAGHARNVAMTNHNQFFKNIGNNLYMHDFNRHAWKTLGCCIVNFASSADGSVAVGIAGDGTLWFKTLLNAATNHWSAYQNANGHLTHAAINADGTLLFGVNKNHAYKTVFGNIINGAKNNWARSWLGFSMPAGAGIGIEVSIGGQHELWVIDEHYELYHAWIHHSGNSLSVNNWQKMNVQILTISATASGALWGTAMNGLGVVYCRGRRVNNFARKCEYIPGPYGEIADTS